MNHAVTASPRGLPGERAEATDPNIPAESASAPILQGPLKVSDDFTVLDDPVEQKEFTEFAEIDGRRTAQSVLMVQGMYCAACADAVEDAVCEIPGVLKAEVHAATRRLTVQWDPLLTQPSVLATAVGRAGYRLLPAHQALSISNRLAEGRKVLWRLFVSGICMMQVMMYAIPAYITSPGDIPADMEHLLRWASWVLTMPVILFVSGTFFASAWRDLQNGRVGMDTPVSIGILVTFVVSSLATFDPTGPWGRDVWYDSLTMFVFFLMGGRYLEFKSRDRTAGALDSLMNRLPEACERRKPDGGYESVSVRRLEVGDVVRVIAGQAFPGDGELLTARASIDEALLTGEFQPVTRVMGESIVAGSFNLAGPVEVRVDRIGADTRFAQIVALMEKASTEKPRLAVLADRIAGPFLSVVLLAALLSALYWWHVDPSRALAIAVSVLIVTCPCALSLATPAAMLAAAGALARRGVLVRRLQALETLSGVTDVVFDKTGTLTHDRVALQEVLVRSGVMRGQALGIAAALAVGSLHPVSRAISQEATADAESSVEVSDVTEHAGSGMEGHSPVHGRLKLGSAAFCGLGMDAVNAESNSPRAYLVDDQGWLATFVFDEGIRSDAYAAVAALKALGVTTWLLSGDRMSAAKRVGDAVGVDHVIAGASPEQKLAEVARLQQTGARVAMVGDGLNDGPVLARANVSFALGTAAPLAQAQADYVVQGGQVMDVAHALLLARHTLRVVHQNLLWAAVYNVISVPLALMGYMPPWAAGLGMAISSFWVIGNALRLNRKA